MNFIKIKFIDDNNFIVYLYINKLNDKSKNFLSKPVNKMVELYGKLKNNILRLTSNLSNEKIYLKLKEGIKLNKKVITTILLFIGLSNNLFAGQIQTHIKEAIQGDPVIQSINKNAKINLDNDLILDYSTSSDYFSLDTSKNIKYQFNLKNNKKDNQIITEVKNNLSKGIDKILNNTYRLYLKFSGHKDTPEIKNFFLNHFAKNIIYNFHDSKDIDGDAGWEKNSNKIGLNIYLPGINKPQFLEKLKEKKLLGDYLKIALIIAQHETMHMLIVLSAQEKQFKKQFLKNERNNLKRVGEYPELFAVFAQNNLFDIPISENKLNEIIKIMYENKIINSESVEWLLEYKDKLVNDSIKFYENKGKLSEEEKILYDLLLRNKNYYKKRGTDFYIKEYSNFCYGILNTNRGENIENLRVGSYAEEPLLMDRVLAIKLIRNLFYNPDNKLGIKINNLDVKWRLYPDYSPSNTKLFLKNPQFYYLLVELINKSNLDNEVKFKLYKYVFNGINENIYKYYLGEEILPEDKFENIEKFMLGLTNTLEM